jgi:hypothetical protein
MEKKVWLGAKDNLTAVSHSNSVRVDLDTECFARTHVAAAATVAMTVRGSTHT